MRELERPGAGSAAPRPYGNGVDSDAERASILVIEDEPMMRDLLSAVLKRSGFRVETAADGDEGLSQFRRVLPDLVIVDWVLPGIDGVEVCRRLQQMGEAPVILLSALGSEKHVQAGLDSGAIDYVVKPFNTEVLSARVRSALRRTRPRPAPVRPLTYSDEYLTVDLDQQTVVAGGAQVRLSATEARLLAYLLENADRVCTIRQILEHVWGGEWRNSVHYVYTYIGHLRRKLEKNPKQPQYLVAKYRVGYKFVPRKRHFKRTAAGHWTPVGVPN